MRYGESYINWIFWQATITRFPGPLGGDTMSCGAIKDLSSFLCFICRGGLQKADEKAAISNGQDVDLRLKLKTLLQKASPRAFNVAFHPRRRLGTKSIAENPRRIPAHGPALWTFRLMSLNMAA